MNPTKVLVEGDSETICEDTLTSLDLLDKWCAYGLESIEDLRNILLGIPELDFEESDIWGGPGQSYIYSKVLYRNKRRLRDQINRAIDELISEHGLVKKKVASQRNVVEPRSADKNNSSPIASKSNLEFEQAVLDLLKPVEHSLYSTQIVKINKDDDLLKLVDGKKFIARIADWHSSPSVWTFFYCIEISDGSQLLIQERRSGNMVGGNVRRLSTKETAYSPIINFRADEVVRRKILAREIFQIGRPNKVDMSFLGNDLETSFNDLRARADFHL